jgi:hypothetical protein
MGHHSLAGQVPIFIGRILGAFRRPNLMPERTTVGRRAPRITDTLTATRGRLRRGCRLRNDKGSTGSAPAKSITSSAASGCPAGAKSRQQHVLETDAAIFRLDEVTNRRGFNIELLPPLNSPLARPAARDGWQAAENSGYPKTPNHRRWTLITPSVIGLHQRLLALAFVGLRTKRASLVSRVL